VDPSFAYWTTAGDFIFVVLLSGQASVLSPFAGSFILEMLRMFASALFPNAWQLTLGAIMLAIVMFLPSGLGHLGVIAYRTLKRQRESAPAPGPGTAREAATR
jgi:ABC-type branched-subunit amino acid transport system permease subunit